MRNNSTNLALVFRNFLYYNYLSQNKNRMNAERGPGEPFVRYSPDQRPPSAGDSRRGGTGRGGPGRSHLSPPSTLSSCLPPKH